MAKGPVEAQQVARTSGRMALSQSPPRLHVLKFPKRKFLKKATGPVTDEKLPPTGRNGLALLTLDS